MSQQVKFSLDKNTVDIMENVPAELRNAAAIVAIKMFSKSSVYKKYFCEGCVDDVENEDIEDYSEQSTPPPTTPSVASEAVVNWDTF